MVQATSMAESEDAPSAQPTSLKRPSFDIESLQRKKFKTDELPLTPVQQTAIQSLLHAFKKKGSFDAVRKDIWKEFNGGVCDLLYLCWVVLIDRRILRRNS